MKISLALIFVAIASLYASVGFGGGSSYTAVLAVTDTPYILIPIISLLCNIAVVSANSLRYILTKMITLRQAWPLCILSIPAAFLGGRLNVSEGLFLSLLSAALLLAGARMILASPYAEPAIADRSRSPMISAIIGAAIGFFSGVVGIGGGIFLAPVLYRLRWGSAQAIAALCSVFILVNSIAGLLGQLSKPAWQSDSAALLSYWPLLIAVLIGGLFGNMISIKWLRADHLRRITGLLILIVAIRLIFKVTALMA